MKIVKIKYNDGKNGFVSGIFVRIKDGYQKLIILNNITYKFKEIISESEIGEIEEII